MDIQPLNGILNGIGSGGEWDQQRQLKRLIGQWEAIVGATVAQHSCPLELHNGILQVATSTAVWAQNLSFERRRILKKLNQRAHFKILGLTEIRFSTAQWHNRPGSSGAFQIDKRLNSYQQQLQWQQHPSRLPPLKNERPDPELAKSASQAFDRWSQRRQQQVNQVPPCPQCQTPTPEGELQRWGICAFCMTEAWQADKNANQPDGSQEAETWAKGAPSSRTVEEARLARNQPGPEADERAPEESQSQSPAKLMFQQQQTQLVQASPQSQSPKVDPPQSSTSPPQQLQPRTGLPPVAWPSPAKSTEAALPRTVAQPEPAIDQNLPGQRSPEAPLQPQATHQGDNSAGPTSVSSLYQNSALTGRLTSVVGGEPALPNQQPLSDKAEASLLENQHNLPPEHQQQAAWAQAFQMLKSQEAQRQVQQAEFERRTAAQIRQVTGDRISQIPASSQASSSTSTGPDSISAKPESKEIIRETASLTSGRSKPVLKKKRHIPPQRSTRPQS